MNNAKCFIKKNSFLLVGIVFVTLTFICTTDVPFFGDALSESLAATWFYEHHFLSWTLPTDINSAHSPFWAFLLAFLWKLFGKTLLVSRLLLWSLNIAVIFQLNAFIKNYGSSKIASHWYILLLLEPTFLAQTTLLNNDVLLLLLCLIAANSIFKNRVVYAFALMGILMCNVRGILFFGGFLVWDIAIRLMNFYFKQKRVTVILSYIVPMLLLGLFLGYQYVVLGWEATFSSINWFNQGELAGLTQILKNIASLVWFFADYGRMLYWFVTGIAFVVYVKKCTMLNAKAKKMLSMWLCLLLANFVLVFSSNPLGHRYFTFLYLIGLFVCINLLHLLLPRKKAVLTSACIAVVIISGHFWIYPNKLPQGWDGSLAYLNYFEPKEQMISFVLKEELHSKNIGTKTQNPNPEIAYLRKGSTMYTHCNSINDVDYYVYSNIENSTTDEEIDALELHWKLIKEFKKGGVFVRLYQKPSK